MHLAAATFTNATGGAATIFYQTGHMAGDSTTVASGMTTGAITGTLLTIDVRRPQLHLSFDFTGQFGNLTLNAAGSPYRLTIVEGGVPPHRTYTLNIRNAANALVAQRPGVVVVL